MIDGIAVKRYGDAFAAFVKDSIGIQKAIGELEYFKGLLKTGPEFLKFMESLEITQDEKNGFIEKVFARGLSDDTRNFLKFLLKRGRINIVVEIAEYIKAAYSDEGVSEVFLRSAFALEPKTVDLIRKRLEGKFQKKIRITSEVDKRLLGGVQVMIGNILIDGTVRRGLDDLKEKLAAVKV